MVSRFGALSKLGLSDGREVYYYSLPDIERAGAGRVSRLPFSIRVVLESLVRNVDGDVISDDDVISLSNWNGKDPGDRDIPFKVSRILMQDFTGVPAVVDLAAMREYAVRKGNDANIIQPLIPVDLIIDHSVQVDSFNTVDSIRINQQMEVERNIERYHLLKWAGRGFENFRVYPPSAGICHQVNLEYLATCVSVREVGGRMVAMPDTLVGTDSHTTMVNGLGVVGFGVGGIEAEAALLGQPVSFTTPKVLGVELVGALGDGVTATDFALTLTRMLRERGVVGMFVEFFGDGIKGLSLPDRATLSNMCPEYGATVAVFPPDEETFDYMGLTGRSAEQIELVRSYYSAQGMLNIDYRNVEFSDLMRVDLGSIVPSVSGPDQPKEQIPLQDIGREFDRVFLNKSSERERLSREDSTRWSAESEAPESGRVKDAPTHNDVKSVRIRCDDGYEYDLSDGDVVISSITSCTNTSNPSVMVAAGLLAKRAVELGLRVNTRRVKTSLGPGSRVVTTYLERAGLMEYLKILGYSLVGYGCITCIGNSGPLIDKQSDAINKNGLEVAAVLSGNRNYEARIHRDVRANYLMSPPLLIAFGIAGSVRIDLTREPLGKGADGRDVYLKDIWPKKSEIDEVIKRVVKEEMFENTYGKNIYDVNSYWNDIDVPDSLSYAWNEDSTYIKLPPFFSSLEGDAEAEVPQMKDCAVLAVFGDSLSTDHISPAGAIGTNSPAGRYLISKGVQPKDFNTYGSRRGNHEVMMRGTFANNRIKNLIMNDVTGGVTKHFPDGAEMSIYDAAIRYAEEGRGVLVFGGSEYGSGSSRDWAAKGPALLGVRAVIAKSFERIHRSNLVGMGVLPLQLNERDYGIYSAIDFSKPVSIELEGRLRPRGTAIMHYFDRDGGSKTAELLVRVDTPVEVNYYMERGILNYVLRRLTRG